jgi:hypothetical protein
MRKRRLRISEIKSKGSSIIVACPDYTERPDAATDFQESAIVDLFCKKAKPKLKQNCLSKQKQNSVQTNRDRMKQPEAVEKQQKPTSGFERRTKKHREKQATFLLKIIITEGVFAKPKQARPGGNSTGVH